MREGFPSNTALWVAVQRALHQTADAPPIFVDPLACRLVASHTALLAAARASAAESRRLRTTLAVRAVVAEAMIAEAVGRGADQCVVVGAGLDTFAFRHRFSNLTVFELDHPSTQAAKRELLRAAEIDVPPSVRFVATDLVTGDPEAALVRAGFAPHRPAVFMIMGVVPYLAEATLMRLVGTLATLCAAGSELVLDYTEPFDRASPAIRANYEAAAARVAAEGEPWVAFYEPCALHAAMTARGFAIVADLDAAALDARCCAGRADDVRVAQLVHVLRARLERRLQRHLQREAAWRHQGG